MRTPLYLLVSMFVVGCSEHAPEVGPGSDPRRATTPRGEQLLLDLDQGEVGEAIGWAGMEIDEWRAVGVERMISALKALLAARGIDSSPLDKIDHTHIGEPLPTRPLADDSSSSAGGIGKRQSALTELELSEYFPCPILAPEDNTGTPCDELVKTEVARVMDQIEQGQGDIEQQVGSDYDGLTGPSKDFITAWAQEGQRYGARTAAIYAEHELRAAHRCDEKGNAAIVAFALGIEQGVHIVEQYRGWAMEQVKGCVINTDRIAERVREIAKTTVKTFMVEHRVCVSADISDQNPALIAAEVRRKKGIIKGIDERVEVLRQELFEQRRLTPCCDGTALGDATPVVGAPATPSSCDVGKDCNLVQSSRRVGWQEIDGNCVCCRRRRVTGLLACKGPGPSPLYCGESRNGKMFCQCEAIPLGSPVVIDLDDDGLTLSGEAVSFDVLDSGEAQRTTWVGSHEGMLAIDLDGDGQIGSSAELFGDRASCGDHACYDGPAALQYWDDPARGGNGDGMLDRHDLVFARLLLWVDADQDGRSQPGELRGLAAHGIRAINLDASYQVERRPEGSITSQLDVLTDGGFRRAYDVWFRLRIGPSQLGAFKPSPR